MTGKVPTVVLGASGYAGSELLRLLSGHPHLKLEAAVSESRAGELLGTAFPYLQDRFAAMRFVAPADLASVLESTRGTIAVFSAANHGASAPLVKEVLQSKENREVFVVDLSADFRYQSEAAYEAVYGTPHPAPELLSEFTCALPEHLAETPGHIGHPGCFATALLLSVVPLLELGIVHPELFAVGITGSTGSGGSPKPTTHHPFRHANLFAYKPLAHRHVPEVTVLVERATGVRPALHFVPHSGPFARGIHVTVQAALRTELDGAAIAAELDRFYRDAPFVRVVSGTPRLKDVVGSNYAHLGVASDGETVAVMTVIDNLTKGAAGGGIQWMNRLLGLPETAGLTMPALGGIG